MANHDITVRAEAPPADHATRWDEATSPAPGPAAGLPGNGTFHSVANALEAASQSAPYRVLVVEDDRSQALFAQSVLTGAGIEAVIEADPHRVLPNLHLTKPDLILLDLHLKDLDGIALTRLIREIPQLQLLPIVFLSGDPDPERQYEVLASGGDDYLAKPIRPRHLIAAVSNRIHRARQRARLGALAQSTPMAGLPASPVAEVPTNPDTGLPTRQHLFQQLQESLDQRQPGHLLFVEISGALGLREHYGYANFERVMLDAGQWLAKASSPHLVSRLNDHSFLVMALDVPDAQQAGELAGKLRTHLASHALSASENDTVRLRSTVGVAALSTESVSAHDAINAAERAALDARLHPDGIAFWQNANATAEQHALQMLEGTLEPAYQPIVAVAGEPIAQFQVLLRLQQSNGTLLSAGQVIPVAERAGRIIDLDQQVVDHTLDILDRYRHANPPLRLFVTQSPRTLMHEGYTEWLEKGLQQRHLQGTALVIDVRLPDALIHGISLAQLAERLRSAGISLCISQFEPTDEALALLKILPVSFIRLSHRFATHYADDHVRQDLARAQQHARQHHVQLIVQQVEDPQAAASMWMSGVDFMQGNIVQSVGNALDFDFHNAAI